MSKEVFDLKAIRERKQERATHHYRIDTQTPGQREAEKDLEAALNRIKELEDHEALRLRRWEAEKGEMLLNIEDLETRLAKWEP